MGLVYSISRRQRGKHRRYFVIADCQKHQFNVIDQLTKGILEQSGQTFLSLGDMFLFANWNLRSCTASMFEWILVVNQQQLRISKASWRKKTHTHTNLATSENNNNKKQKKSVTSLDGIFINTSVKINKTLMVIFVMQKYVDVLLMFETRKRHRNFVGKFAKKSSFALSTYTNNRFSST